MKTTDQPFEIRAHDMTGFASLDMYSEEVFNAFLTRTAGYDPDRFDPVALKIFIQGKKPVLTLYALDKSKQELKDCPQDKLPVKKFKMAVTWADLFSWIKRFDLVVSTGAYDVKDMRVINK